jgi:hypothetical protein
VLLFGSATAATWTPGSDVDMLYVVSAGASHRARFHVDDVSVDVFVESCSGLEMLLARREPVVVRMLAEGRSVYGSEDCVAELRGKAAAMLAAPMAVDGAVVNGMRMRAITLLTSLTDARDELENEHLFSLLLVSSIGGYFYAHGLWPVSERSALRYVLDREPSIADAVRTMLDRSVELEIRRHAAHRVCTVAFNGLSGVASG